MDEDISCLERKWIVLTSKTQIIQSFSIHVIQLLYNACMCMYSICASIHSTCTVVRSCLSGTLILVTTVIMPLPFPTGRLLLTQLLSLSYSRCRLYHLPHPLHRFWGRGSSSAVSCTPQARDCLSLSRLNFTYTLPRHTKLWVSWSCITLFVWIN